MDRTLNRIELRGNIGADPKITQMENGANVVRFSLATHETFKTKEGNIKEETTWHNIVLWDYNQLQGLEGLKKGAYVNIVGKIKYSRYKAQNGEERFTAEIIAQKIDFPVMKSTINS